MLVLRSTQAWVAPAGALKAKITLVDGGTSSQTTNNGNGTAKTLAGRGGNTSTSVRTITPGVSYTATVGAGGAGPAAYTNAQNAGGLSSFSGPNFTTLTTSNGDIQVPGSDITAGSSGTSSGGTSFFGNNVNNSGAAGTQIGQGGGSTIDGNAGYSGAAGAVIIEY